MQVDGAIIKEQGFTFSIVVVKPNVLQNSTLRENFRLSAKTVFPAPIILMAQDSKGVPTYHGRKDIVKFLSKINISRIPWKHYTINYKPPAKPE